MNGSLPENQGNCATKCVVSRFGSTDLHMGSCQTFGWKPLPASVVRCKKWYWLGLHHSDALADACGASPYARLWCGGGGGEETGVKALDRGDHLDDQALADFR